MTDYSFVALVAVVVIIALAFLIFWLQLRQGRTAEEKAEPEVAAASTESTASATASKPEPDDLKRIEGIGPKISNVLQDAGIMTFSQLAATDMARLKQILSEAKIGKLSDPATWPEQSGLAAAGKWDELETLQDELKGGRRV